MKVATIAALAALAACAAAPPEPLRNPKRTNRPPEDEAARVRPVPLALAALPVITLPALPVVKVRSDPSELVRWPLSHAEHPSLDPSFAIAKVFAQPGVSWIDLCARGVQNRRGGGIAEQHRAYLTAWCEVLKRDTQSALTRFAPLMSTTVRGIPDAVRRDVANVVVDAGPADAAEDLLNRARIDDLAVYHLVAATYAEVGRLSDARYFSGRAMASISGAATGKCERTARDILLAPSYQRPDLIQDFKRLASCRELAEDLACRHAPKSCSAGSPAHAVHDVYNNWPAAPVDSRRWFDLAVRAFAAFPNAAGAAELATAALGAALRSTHCDDAHVRLIVLLAGQVRRSPNHAVALDPELDRIIVKTQKLCLP